MIEILQILCGGIAYRIRGGAGNEIVRKLLNKPYGWEIGNNYIRAVWAAYLTLIFPVSWGSILVFALSMLGVIPSYWGGKFDLSRKENCTWKNYAWLSARGAFICLPATLCLFPIYPQLLGGVLAGLLFVPCYLTGNVLAKYAPIMRHTQWGEYLLGCSIIGGVLLWKIAQSA